MRALLTISFILILAVYGCTKEKDPGDCPVTCGNHGAHVYFAGYSVDEIDTVILTSYKNDDLYTTVVKIDTISDTTSTKVNGKLVGLSSIPVGSGNDYDLFVPATTQTFRITTNHTITVDTFPCERTRSCSVPFRGATITGGQSRGYSASVDDAYIELKK